MSFWDWIFGLGKRVQRDGPAHSSDRHGFWRDLWKLRKVLNMDVEHSGSVDIYDHFGCAPYNDNDMKRERMDDVRALVMGIRMTSPDVVLRNHATQLLDAFDIADESKGWRDQ